MSEPRYCYWNRENFEGLAALSGALRADSRLERLARYCDLREKGLRRQAFAELESFLEQARSWNESVQREIALLVLDSHWRIPAAHQFLAAPLRTGFVERVLEEWRAAEPGNCLPSRHLALLRADRELLDEALRMNPQDDRVRTAIARILIDFVDHATHHLVEGVFIGNETEAATALSEALALLKEASDLTAVVSLAEEARRFADLLADWQEYQGAPEGSFFEWCRARNRNHRWWRISYYDGASG